MSFLDEAGDLSVTPLAAILIEAWNLRRSGALTVDQKGGASKLFFRDGVPVGAQVFTGFRPLGHFLLAKGLIDIEALERCLAEMARAQRPQGEILLEMGAIDRPTLDAALSEQQAGYVALIAALQEGAYRFDGSEKVPAWTGPIRIHPLRAILDALATPPAEALVESALRQGAGGIALAPGYADQAESFGWTLAEQALVAGLPGRAATLISASGLPPERARAALAALLLLGLAEPDSGLPPPEDEADGDVVDLSEIAASASPRTAPSPPASTAAAPAVVPPPAPPPPSAPVAPTAPARRSDPEEARQRRQRLLSRAMGNMGLKPIVAPRPEATKAKDDAPVAPSAAEQTMRRALQFVVPRTREKDLFARLGLAKTAGPEDVKTAYHQLVRQFHPDKYALPGLADLQPALKDLLASFNEAYAVLSDKNKRAEYLRQVGAGSAAATKEAAAAARVDFQKGEACHRTRDYGRARQFFEAAIQGDPRAEYRAALAATILADPKATDRGRLREILEEATKDPACDRAQYLAGVVARQDGDDARAERAFRAALKANPGNADAARELRRIEAARQGGADGRARK
ncbi:MAG TPA: DUF4388 domain-containing protein [Anaeromyxobacteraceae bacterium]|nr:DUF4388 domain-containing protein [Anaeromyxobacteraceae bacterium]